MKKSYIKLIIFSFTFILFFLLNSLKFQFLNQTTLNIILILLLGLTYFLFGFEKNRKRYWKDIVLEIIIILISFFLLYYLSGILIGFAKTKNYLTITSFKKFIFPIFSYIILKEYLRYQLVMKASEEKKLIYLICIFFIVLENTVPFSIHPLSFNQEMFLFLALTFIPSITENILCTYLSLNFGYMPGIIYLWITKLYFYILPLIPNPNEYIYSMIFFLLPVFILFKIKKWQQKDRTNPIEREQQNKSGLIYYLPALIITIVLVYFVSGYFKYYAIAIASNSMSPCFYKGDVVIIDQKYQNLNQGDIIAFKYEGTVIVHRIHQMIKTKNEYFIYTKGDANRNPDNYKITKDMILGVVKCKIPYIGKPTVLLNEYW
ncbi:MAG: signal peptidase I [Bacilli bacterium]|nr:signal peptidase I [Bacilli bacterium]